VIAYVCLKCLKLVLEPVCPFCNETTRSVLLNSWKQFEEAEE